MRIRDAEGIAVVPGASYRLLGANRTDATHYQIKLPDQVVIVGCPWAAADGGRRRPDPQPPENTSWR